jgi:hypothetical protein
MKEGNILGEEYGSESSAFDQAHVYCYGTEVAFMQHKQSEWHGTHIVYGARTAERICINRYGFWCGLCKCIADKKQRQQNYRSCCAYGRGTKTVKQFHDRPPLGKS